MDEDDDVPKLSADTLAILQNFLREQAEQDGDEVSGGAGEEKTEEFSMVKENWGMSQFWYDAETSKIVADELWFLSAESSRSIACIACPSLYTQLKKIHPEARVSLLEYDSRFGKYGSDFVFYDYKQPLNIPSELQGGFDIIVADPPYLSKGCLENTVETVKYLAKDPQNAHILLLTGGVQRENALNLLNARPCHFRPRHTNKLGNEFLLFTNYDPETRLGGWEHDD